MGQNIIPPMTHPLCKAWEQPSISDILIENDNAIMAESTLKKLKNYSHSFPSGVYEGKMWRSIDRQGINYLWWYGTSNEPNRCSINNLEIILID